MSAQLAEAQVSGGQGNEKIPEAPDPMNTNVNPHPSGGDSGFGAANKGNESMTDETAQDLNDENIESVIDVDIAEKYLYNKVPESPDSVTVPIFVTGKSNFSIFSVYEKIDQLRKSPVLAKYLKGFRIGGVALETLKLEDWAAFFDCNEYEDENGRVENRRYVLSGSHPRNSLTIVRTNSTKKRKTRNSRFGFLDRTRLRLLDSKGFLAKKTLLIPRTDHGGTRTSVASTREIGACRRATNNDTSHQAYSSKVPESI